MNWLLLLDLLVWFLLGATGTALYQSRQAGGERATLLRRTLRWLVVVVAGLCLATLRYLVTSAGRAHALRMWSKQPARPADPVLPVLPVIPGVPAEIMPAIV